MADEQQMSSAIRRPAEGEQENPIGIIDRIGYNIEQHMRAARVAKWQTR
jgi:hypothetical protein